MNILNVDHFYIHSDLWESYTFCIFPYINLFFNVFLVRTGNLLHMDVDTISKDQTGVFNKMHSIPFHSLLPNGLLLAMGFTYPSWNWLSWIVWAQQNIKILQDYTHILISIMCFFLRVFFYTFGKLMIQISRIIVNNEYIESWSFLHS